MAEQDPNQDRHGRIVEEPGDTNSADIVGRTGEQMPVQSHDGNEADDRSRPLPPIGEADEVDGSDPV